MNIFDLQATISLNGDAFMSGVEQAKGAFTGLGDSISAGTVALGTALGNMATKAAGAVVDFGKDSIETGKSFESAMSQIAATLGYTTDDIAENINGAGDNYDALKRKASEMGRETNFTASQAAEGLNILAMSGFDAQQSISMVGDVLHLAAAGSMDMASAAGFISGSMKGFADETKDSGYYANLMAKGATLANTSVSQLGEAMASGAAGAAAYSQSAESMTISLLRLAEQSVVGSAAGTALSAAMKNLYTPTDQAKKALDELGVAAYKDGKALDFNDVVNELSAALSGFSEEEANAYKQTIFGIQGLDAFNKMTVTGVETQARWAEALSGASEGIGEAAKQYDTMTSNLQGAQDMFSSALEGLQNAVYEKLAGPMTEATKIATDALSAITAGFEEGGLRGALESLGSFIKTTFAELWSKVQLPPEVEAIGEKIGEIFEKVKSAVEGLNLGEKFSALAEQAKGAFERIKSTVEGLNLGEKFGEIGEKIKGALDKIRGTIDSFDLGEKFSGIGEKFKGVFEGVKTAISNIDFGDVFNSISEKVSGIIDAVRPLAEEKFAAIGDVFEQVKSGLKGFGDAFKNIELPSLSGVASGVSELFSAYNQFKADKMSAAVSLVQGFLGAFKDSSIGDSIKEIAGGVAGFIGAFSEKAVEILQLAGGAVKGFIAGFMDSPAIDAIKSAAENVAKFIGVFSEAVGGIILEVAGAVQSFLSSFDSERLGAVVGEIAAGVSSLFGTIVSVASGIIERVAGAIKGFISAFNESGVAGQIADIAMSIGEFFAPFSETLGTVIGFVGEKIGELITWIGQFASQAVKEIPAVLDVFQSALSAVGEMFSAIWDALQPLMQFLAVEFSQAMEKVGSLLVNVWENCKNAAVTFFEVVRDLASAVTAALAGDFETAASLVQSAFSSLGSFIQGLVGQIAGWFSGLASQMISIGADIVDGLKQGIANAWNSLTSWMSEKTSGLVDGVKNLLGIHSPSRVFAGIGKNLVLGMENGWGGEFGDLEKQVDRDLSALTGTARLAFEDSALGRSSAAGISSMLAAANGSGRSSEPIEINLMLDGDVAASALYDPLRRTAFQKGQNSNMEAAYA